MILFIDDEPRVMNSYVQYLELKLKDDDYDLQFRSSVDEALEFFEQRVGEIDLVILDIMMPPGKAFSNQNTNGGLKTGLAFYERIRGQSVDLPILIFTNYVDEDFHDGLRQDHKCKVLQKTDYLLDDFVVEVRKMLPASNTRVL